MNILRIFLEYLIVFSIIFILHYLLFIRNRLKLNKNKVPIELNYLIALYGIKAKKLNYKNFVYIYCLINSFIISTIYIIVIYLVKGLVCQIIIGILMLILLTIICYGLLGRYYKRKGEKDV